MKKILEEATKIDDDGVEDIEDKDDEELVAPSARDVEKSLEILKSLSLFRGLSHVRFHPGVNSTLSVKKPL